MLWFKVTVRGSELKEAPAFEFKVTRPMVSRYVFPLTKMRPELEALYGVVALLVPPFTVTIPLEEETPTEQVFSMVQTQTVAIPVSQTIAVPLILRNVHDCNIAWELVR